MNRKVLPLVSLGLLPRSLQKELGEEGQGFQWTEIPDGARDADLAPFLRRLEMCSKGLADGPVVILCPSGSEFFRQLDRALARLSRPGRELHLVLPLPFGFEGDSGTLDAGVLRRSLFFVHSVTTLDGRSLVSRLSQQATIADLFRVQSAKLAHLLADLRQILAAPRHARVRRAMVGELRWEGTWPSPALPTEHLVTLLRIFEEPHLSLLVCRGISEPERLFRLPRRLGTRPFLLCRGPERSLRRLGAFAAVPLRELL